MKISAKKPEYLIRIQQSIQRGPWKCPKPKNTLNLKTPAPGFSIPDVGGGGSSVLATSQFHPASGRDFSSSHLAAASVLISAEPEKHQRWRAETHTEFSAGIMRKLLYHFALHLCYSSQFQQAHKKTATAPQGCLHWHSRRKWLHVLCAAKCTFTISQHNPFQFHSILRHEKLSSEGQNPMLETHLADNFSSHTLIPSAAFVASPTWHLWCVTGQQWPLPLSHPKRFH